GLIKTPMTEWVPDDIFQGRGHKDFSAVETEQQPEWVT
ncbi:MAG: 3-alpha-hydroxysteroid dehydrogenase, partial [Mycobacterium sp.]